jgi:hypothetical protein
MQGIDFAGLSGVLKFAIPRNYACEIAQKTLALCAARSHIVAVR